MSPQGYDELEQVYESTAWGTFEPQYITVSIEMYTDLIRVYSTAPAVEEKDEFDEWVKQTREEAKVPRNRHLRRFLELGPCRKRPAKLTKSRYARIHK